MNPVNDSGVRARAVGLDSLHSGAFAAMARCGHRVVAIEKQTASKFQVTTNCVSGICSNDHERCVGEMQFHLTTTGPNLYLGQFHHHEQCLRSARHNFEPGTIEDIPCGDKDFVTNWPDYVAGSTQLAAENVRVAEQRQKYENEQASMHGYDQVYTSADSIGARRLLKDLKKLSNQLLDYFSHHATS